MKYLLAIDAGTTSNRAILFDEDANVISVDFIIFSYLFRYLT